MNINHMCYKVKGRILVDLQDVILYLYRIKDSNLTIKQITKFYEELIEDAKVKIK